MAMSASIGTHNCICAPRTPEQPKFKDPINLYFQHKFEENKEQKLAQLKEKHEAGEISDFQYKIEKYLVQHSEFKPPIDPVVHLDAVV